jgi:hypothetical protein
MRSRQTGRRLKVVAMPAPVKPWSPVELLEEFLVDVKAGTITPTGIAVHFFTEDPDGTLRPGHWHANLSYPELLALLAVQKQHILEKWRS